MGILDQLDIALERLVDGLVAEGCDRDAARYYADTVIRPLLTAADRAGIDPVEAIATYIALSNAADREGLVTQQEAFRYFLKLIESGEYARSEARDLEAQRCMERFDKTTDEYRRRYKAEKGALTFDEAVTAFRLLPWQGVTDDRGLDAARMMFPSILEGFERRGGLTDQWKRHLLYKAILPRVEREARMQGGEAWQAAAKGIHAWGVRLKAEGAAKRPRGKHDPLYSIGRDMLVGHALLSLSGCGMRVTARDENPCLARAMAVASGIPYRAIKRAWERYPLRARHARNPDPEKPPIAPGVQCAKCGKAGKVPVYRTREGGGRLCTDCCEW